jgi:hypothetical protein
MSIFYSSRMASKFYVHTIVALGCSLVFIGCPKECVSPERAYQANHQILISDSISVGDTIWLKSEMDCKNMYNYVTSTTDHFCGANFSFTLGMIKYTIVESKYTAIGAVDDFKTINIIGRIWNSKEIPSPHAVNQVEFEAQGDKYLLEVGIVPQKQGYFTIGLGNGGSFGGRHCDRAALSNKIEPNISNMELFIKVNNNRDFTGEDLSSIFCFEVHE